MSNRLESDSFNPREINIVPKSGENILDWIRSRSHHGRHRYKSSTGPLRKVRTSAF